MKIVLTRLALALLALSCSDPLLGQDEESETAKAAAAERAISKAAENTAKNAAERAKTAKAAAEKVAAAKAAEKKAAVVKAAAAANNGLDAQAQQYEQLMRPRMWRELEFIRQNCDLKPEQRPTIRAAAEVGLKQAAKDLLHNRRNGGQGAAGTAIRKYLLETLEKTLTPEQMARYQEVAARRAAAIKNVTIRSTISRLDSFLYLSREQRDKISATLAENWNEGWEQWLMVSRYGGLYFPMIPDQHLLGHLNEQQKQVWQGAQKVNPGNVWGGEQQQAEDDWWSGKDAAEKPNAEAPGAGAKPAGEGDK